MLKPVRPLSLRKFVSRVGWPAATEVARAAGVGRPFLAQIASGHRSARYVVAQRLAAAARQLTPYDLDVAGLMKPPTYRPPHPRQRARQADAQPEDVPAVAAVLTAQAHIAPLSAVEIQDVLAAQGAPLTRPRVLQALIVLAAEQRLVRAPLPMGFALQVQEPRHG